MSLGSSLSSSGVLSTKLYCHVCHKPVQYSDSVVRNAYKCYNHSKRLVLIHYSCARAVVPRSHFVGRDFNNINWCIICMGLCCCTQKPFCTNFYTHHKCCRVAQKRTRDGLGLLQPTVLKTLHTHVVEEGLALAYILPQSDAIKYEQWCTQNLLPMPDKWKSTKERKSGTRSKSVTFIDIRLLSFFMHYCIVQCHYYRIVIFIASHMSFTFYAIN